MTSDAVKQQSESGLRKVDHFYCEDCTAEIQPEGEAIIEACPYCGSGNIYPSF